MTPIISVLIIILASSILRALSKKIKLPNMILLIIFGIFLNMPGIKEIIQPESALLTNIGEIGLIALMFLAGLESSWSKLQKEEKDSFFIAIFSSITPFILGVIVFVAIGLSVETALIIGICMSITAEASKARVLIELKKIKTKVGSAMMGAGVIDDVLGITLFIIVTYVFGAVNVMEYLILTSAVLAFIIGIISQGYLGRNNKAVTTTEHIVLWTMVPFFFVSIGTHLNLNKIIIDPTLTGLMILIGILGKLIGAQLTKKFTKFTRKQLYLIGWAMNSRGAIEMALALIAFKAGIIQPEIYSGLILMAIITTLIFPVIIASMIRKNKRIMY